MDNNSSATAARIIPLMQELNRVEDHVAALVSRLDPIVSHVPQQDNVNPPTSSVTGRLHSLGDSLQYLLDNLEL